MPGFSMSKARNVVLVLLSGVAVLGGLSAQVNEALSAKYACVACHELDFKKVGPAYEDVAGKYRGADAKTVESLVKHVHEGSAGAWGKDIMPAQPLVPEQDVHTIVKWVLSLNVK